ncbi:hypothetical protein [Roseiterribacter gracilis]|uniref:Methylaspartate ammonia-lyase n=1 Tax=Roseiterribacter gracilis TaxID=2812848 RepID=A0A8S8XAX6_9PROT|nr:hypothetical protein TMPK1_10060 [Rhodospirillales bacterium TMPK1]
MRILILLLLLLAPPAAAAQDELCSQLAARVDRAGPSGMPVFLRSFDAIGPHDATLGPALLTASFSYDQALATIALVACGDVPHARRTGEALLRAVEHDRHFTDGRVRNAYRAGPIEETSPALNGWWDNDKQRWFEDSYQVGTATGNQIWVALALLTLDEASGDHRFGKAAATAMRFVATRLQTNDGPRGFAGGFVGFEPEPSAYPWRSTEHNLDAAAAFAWLARREPNAPLWRTDETSARGFVDAAWMANEGRFATGTGADGVTFERKTSALDVQVWPLLAIAKPPEAWRAALRWIEQRHAVGKRGYDFNDDRDGVWPEGTAQAALAFHAIGDTAKSRALLTALEEARTPNGFYLSALPNDPASDRITTGFSSDDGAGVQIVYTKRGHLGATCWVLLARLGWNPFTGSKLR